MRTTTNIMCGSQVMVMLYSSYTSRVFDVALASWESSSGALAMLHTVYAMPSGGVVPKHKLQERDDALCENKAA